MVKRKISFIHVGVDDILSFYKLIFPLMRLKKVLQYT